MPHFRLLTLVADTGLAILPDFVVTFPTGIDVRALASFTGTYSRHLGELAVSVTRDYAQPTARTERNDVCTR